VHFKVRVWDSSKVLAERSDFLTATGLLAERAAVVKPGKCFLLLGTILVS